MSRQKVRRGRQAAAGRVLVEVHDGPLDGATVTVRGFTPKQYAQVCGLARAGRIHSPAIDRFIAAFWQALGSPPSARPYNDDERIVFLRWIGAVPRSTWTPLDDMELRRILGGVSDG
ncbi:hypothetical protein ACIQ8D_23955 [Streptomyces sp. NPDC096094]|uniref:hypothetical protein n=1 Tax=Streptomyces sp. NPDC096094 TaxID=3366073 RepID=UPI003806C99B